jgi:toxic protein SymE
VESKTKSVIQKKRQIKIYPKHVQRANGLIIIPEIRLCGLWLKDYGFCTNTIITVISEKNKITIVINGNDG